MHLRLIILALLFLFSERSNARTFYASPMEISDALPVQFWLVGCATYNEHFADGVHNKCWCAPWECDDVIKVQFKDDPSQSFSLVVLDEDGQEIDEIAIEETSVGVYTLDYIPSEASPGVCDQFIQLKIQQNAGTQAIILPDLASWLTHTDSNVAWTLGAAPTVNLPGTGLFTPAISEFLYADFAFIVGVVYSITLDYTRVVNSGTSNPRSSTLVIMDSSYNVLFTEAGTSGVGSGTNSTTITFTADASSSKIGFKFTSGLNCDITVNSVSGNRQLGEDTFIAKTDCLDIKQEQEDTILLTYSNHRNFAGLVYDAVSPENEFFIRIPAIFFHQRFPEEDETMELSTSLVTLNGTLRKQRLLDIDYVPYYFHEKLKLILKHQILEIFNRQWVKQEGYEITEGDRRWPVKKAKCWISEKDFVHRNIL